LDLKLGKSIFGKESMQLQHKTTGDVLIVIPLEKRIDAATATEFKEKMGNWIDAGNHRIVLNLGEVDFIDSSGLGAIVSGLKKIGTNGNLVICAVRETVMSLFRLTRMNRVFEIFPTEDEAVRAFSK
jgi:anti-sigma B factor antagonist